MILVAYLRNFFRPSILMLVMLCVGTGGYHVIEGWTLFDSVYMTVITVTTVGFSEVHPLSAGGRAFTIFLLLGGGVFYAMAVTAIVRTMVEIRYGEFTSRLRMAKTIAELKDHYIICGGGRIADSIATELERSGHDFVIIEKNESAAALVQHPPRLFLRKDALLEETLVEARIQHAAGLAAVLPTDADNLFIVLSARQLKPDLFIQTRITHESSRSKMLAAGGKQSRLAVHDRGFDDRPELHKTGGRRISLRCHGSRKL